jgi:hypothetical protein
MTIGGGGAMTLVSTWPGAAATPGPDAGRNRGSPDAGSACPGFWLIDTRSTRPIYPAGSWQA